MIVTHENGYYVKVLKDSINSAGQRITTFESRGWRPAHADFMTHRDFSRNSSSSRAIPISTFIDQVVKEPAMPIYLGKNQKGMQAREELDPASKIKALAVIAWLRDQAVEAAQMLSELGLHKQTTNRYLEPWMFIKAIFTATNYKNYQYLRDTWNESDPGNAQPEVGWIAKGVTTLLKEHKPCALQDGEWHLPLVSTDDPSDPLYVGRDEAGELHSQFNGLPSYVKYSDDYYYDTVLRLSAGRVARGSYMTHDHKREPAKDIRLHDDLLREMHMSPFEHQACAAPGERSGNFYGWRQLRKQIPGEFVPSY